jgi:drug/metabolite transporter (DMT)-like permease
MTPGGSFLCLGSATAFGAMAIFGKLAFDEGANAGTLLAVRFLVAASVLWCVLLASGALPALRRLRRRDVATAFALGACGYALQSGCYILALERIDASLLSLLLYTFPAIVTVAAVALGAAFVYSTYILVSDGVAQRLPALMLATLVCTGAAISLTVGSTVAGQFHPGAVTAAGWGWLAGLAVVSTVAAIVMFFAGLSRVGPTAASILSTVEPVVTVALASAVFAERLTGAQLAGGALVLTAVVVLRTGRVPQRAAERAVVAPRERAAEAAPAVGLPR